MNRCGHCAYWAVNNITGITTCTITRKDDVGYFAEACEEYAEPKDNPRLQPTSRTTEMKDDMTTNITPQTKVCKNCGRELPIDDFPKHPRTPDGHTSTCRECYAKSHAASIKAASEARRSKAKCPHRSAKPIVGESIDKQYDAMISQKLDSFTDIELYAELKRRGWAGTLKKTETLE